MECDESPTKFRPYKKRQIAFFGQTGEKQIQLLLLAHVPIKRHMIIKDLNPFEIKNAEYFTNRKQKTNQTQWDKRRLELLKSCNGICLVCGQLMEPGQDIEIHHILAKKLGGNNSRTNLMALHRECHRQVTHTTNNELRARFIKLGVIGEAKDKVFSSSSTSATGLVLRKSINT